MKRGFWMGHELDKAVKGNKLGQYNLSDVIDHIFNEYEIKPDTPFNIQTIIRDAYMVQCKDWNRFIYMYGISIFLENWPETIPTSYRGEEYITFLNEKVYKGIKNGSLVTFVAPIQAPIKDNEGTILFQVLGRKYFASGASVVDRPRNERKAFKKAEDMAIMAFQKRGSLINLQDEDLDTMNELIDNHPDLHDLFPVNIFKVDEDAFEEVEKRPFDLTI